MGRWIADRRVTLAQSKTLTFELFNDWKQWAEANGEFFGIDASIFRCAGHSPLREVAHHGRYAWLCWHQLTWIWSFRTRRTGG